MRSLPRLYPEFRVVANSDVFFCSFAVVSAENVATAAAVDAAGVRAASFFLPLAFSFFVCATTTTADETMTTITIK